MATITNIITTQAQWIGQHPWIAVIAIVAVGVGFFVSRTH